MTELTTTQRNAATVPAPPSRVRPGDLPRRALHDLA